MRNSQQTNPESKAPSDTAEIGSVFRTASWVWAGYLAALVGMDALIYANRPVEPVVWYHLINAVPMLVFFGLAYSGLLRKNSVLMTPLLIALISITPILLNYSLDLRLPPAPLSNIEGMVLRQLPVLFVGLALVAWHYQFALILFYSLATYLLELALVNLAIPPGDRQGVLYFVTTIRTISLVVIGIFINILINRLRAQQTALQKANTELTHYASTLETLAVSRERNRLARELHDTLAHTLSGLSVQLETAKAYWEVQPETTYQLLVNSLATTRSGLDETRRALKALRSSSLEDMGLLLALRRLAQQAAERGQLKLDLVLPDQIPTLAPDVEQCIYRIAQESLENVVKHAQAQNLSLHLRVEMDGVRLTIRDDGRGTDLRQVEQNGHFGLAGMRERAHLAGASLVIESTPRQGMQIDLLVKGQ